MRIWVKSMDIDVDRKREGDIGNKYLGRRSQADWFLTDPIDASRNVASSFTTTRSSPLPASSSSFMRHEKRRGIRLTSNHIIRPCCGAGGRSQIETIAAAFSSHPIVPRGARPAACSQLPSSAPPSPSPSSHLPSRRRLPCCLHPVACFGRGKKKRWGS